ncbi:hypothetical protein [Coralloluteibacterium stylophorae]|uniref:ABC transporter substrate-binding protein n=1 Tax=Coralloluteibacterium stylophorae TaxID=1776034 RepID=A0A8J8AZ24_9GAMM|nr:hypothetical protein [Coralloluteibacterium stylophorae]MBS7455925.1 hypothetical protein [Coralloluteibacterium stylophorae]
MKPIGAGSAVLAAVLVLAACGRGPHALGDAQRLEVGDEIRGEITSAARLNLNDGSRSVLYDVDLAAGSVVEFQLEGALRAGLVLLEDGAPVARATADTAEGQLRLSYRAAEAGRRVLAVSGSDADAYGPFRLRARDIPLEEGATLALPSDVAAWLPAEGRDWTVEIAEAGLYVFDARSGAVDAQLEVSGPSGTFGNDDHGSGLDARVTAVLEPGQYRVHVGAYGGGEGLVRVAVEARPLPQGGTVQLGGELALDGPPLYGVTGVDAAGYTLAIAGRTGVRIEMRGEDIDSVLGLEGEGVSLSDDDGAGGYDARIETVLEPGRYAISTRSYGAEGSFVLTATSTELPPDIGGGALQVGTPLDRRLLAGATDRYQLEVERAGDYVIDMMSNDLDSVLGLYRGERPLGEDDDGGENEDARLRLTLEPGRYEIRASSYLGTGGRYSISVQHD